MVKHEHLPHLRPIAQQPIVFLTVVTHRRRNCLLDSVALESLTTIFQRSTTYDDWFVGDFLLMPDHVHLFARATLDAKPLAHWVRTWKSLSARRISSDLRIPAPIWQRDYFDRFLRSADNYSEKWDYVAENPVRKNFCREAKDWRWKGRIHDLRD
jgi:REP element-mobilizing transposase RayT